MRVQLWRPEEDIKSPGALGASGHELPDLCAGNQTRDPEKSNAHSSALSHLSSSRVIFYLLK